MSNNIYDILKKMQSLETPKANLTEGKKAKPDFLDMDKDGDTKEPMKKAVKDKSKGAVAEAVARVEQHLAEKYMGFKKTVAAIKKGGSAEDPEAVAASIGRKKYGKEKFQKAAAAGKKLGEDGSYRGDRPGQTNYKPYSGPTSTPEQERAAMYKKFNIPPEQQADSSPAYQNYKKDKEDARIQQRSASEYKLQTGKDMPKFDEDALSPKQQKFAKLAPPADKITYADKIAGAKQHSKMKSEGPEILKIKADQAKAQGKDQFKVGDKTFPVKEGFPTVSDAEKRMREKEGRTSHGKKTTTATGTRHERDYDAVDKGADVDMTPKGRGRPKKDRFA